MTFVGWSTTQVEEKLDLPAELFTAVPRQELPGSWDPGGKASLSLVTPTTTVTGYGSRFTTVMGTGAVFEVSLISPAFTDSERSWSSRAFETEVTAACCCLASSVLDSAASNK